MVALRAITEENFMDAFNLRLGPGQERFVSHPIRSLAQAYVYRAQCQPFGIYADDRMVGYVMVVYDYDIPEYDIWHMMIDESMQGRGYGGEALDRVIEYIRKKPFGGSGRIALTCNKANPVARRLYESKGFTATGVEYEDEAELVLTIEGGTEMEMIQSFSVDHTRIVPGIFTSRVDRLGDQAVTTYDIRLKRPNREPVIDVAAMHSLEHIIATELRNDPDWKDDVVYWGPMGCLTGFYLILKGEREPRALHGLMLKAFRAVAEAREVPGATERNCGYYRMHNLEMAKWYAAEFVAYLEANANNGDIFEYPKTQRLVTEDGQHFYDS